MPVFVVVYYSARATSVRLIQFYASIMSVVCQCLFLVASAFICDCPPNHKTYRAVKVDDESVPHMSIS